ncbi:protein phosphatase 1 regulatory subunit 3A [Hyperolius riggenbachi]|uniref:protein phosphatase 1 regulatory subunit 3A n=1 Tax=Hyperolius riggenbachi TaxID=752182 RepID=UPI0035A34B22
MESFEENSLNKDKLLEPIDYSADEDDVRATFKPRLSPLPRRRGSTSSDEGDLEPPTTYARKVSFADAFGFDLVSVKEFDTWEIPTVSQTFVMESIKIEEFYLTPSFILPPIGGLMERVYANKVALETVDFIPGTTSMKGIIRVLNLSFEKRVYVRMSLDGWRSSYDLQAEYVPDSCNGQTDQFFFTISLAGPYQKEGAQVHFCICYETAVGTFWDSNSGHNYVLTCQKRERFEEVEKLLIEDATEKNKKSCLKPALSKEEDDNADAFEAEKPTETENIPRIICSHHDDEFTEGSHDGEGEDKGEEKNNEEESDLELFLSQRLMKAKITSSEEKYSSDFSQKSSSQKERQQDNYTIYSTDNSVTQDHYSQEPQPVDNSQEHSPPAELVYSLEAEDLTAGSKNYHSGDHEALSQRYLYETEEPAFPLPETKKDSIRDTYGLESSESPSFIQVETMDLMEILDQNANPSYRQTPVQTTYFSTDYSELQEEQSESIKTETESRQLETPVFTNNDNSQQESSESSGRQNPLMFSQLDHYQDLPCQHETSHSIFLETKHSGSKQSDFNIVSSGEADELAESEEKGEKETRQNKNLIISICETPATTDDISEQSDQNKHTTAEDPDLSHFQSMPSLIAVPSNVTELDYNSSLKPYDLDTEYDMHDKENVVLSDNDKHYDIQYPSDEDKELVSDQADRPVSDVTETELSWQGGSLSTSIVGTATENVTPSTLHVWNEMLGTFPSDVTSGSKVIIAKITEEKGQSETCSQGRADSKRSYIDICDSAGITEPTEICAQSEQKTTLISGADMIVSGRAIEDIPMSGDSERADDNEEEDTDHWNVTAFPEEFSIHEGSEYISKELGEYQNRSDGLLGKSDIHHIELNLATPSNKSLADLEDDKDIIMSDDLIKDTNSKQQIEYADLELEMMEDSASGEEDVDQYEAEQSHLGPSILISEPDDGGEAQSRYMEEQVKLEDTQQYYYHPYTDDEVHTGQVIDNDTETTEHVNVSHVGSKVLCFIMFVVFAGLMYHYDFLVCFLLYLFSLYWLYWEGDRGKML